MDSVLGEGLENILQEVEHITLKYRMNKFKSMFTNIIEDILQNVNELLHLNEIAQRHTNSIRVSIIIEKLERVRQNMSLLNGKIGFNDYERFKVICDELDAHIVTHTLQNV